MIKIENVEVMGWEAAIRGMRNPMNSWEKSDSEFKCSSAISDGVHFPQCVRLLTNGGIVAEIGTNDFALMKKLVNAGTDHRKFMRMITIYMDITAPLYWWKEFDTYKVGTVANSCSAMYRITEKEFTLEDFSYEHLDIRTRKILEEIIKALNDYRTLYINYNPDDFEIKGCPSEKDLWWQMIQLMPSSYNQRCTVMLNYEVLTNIYKSCKNHKLDEWREFCDWIKTLQLSELITAV